MLIDTHCHIHDAQWFTPGQQAEFLQQARERGVERMVTIGTAVEDSAAAREFAQRHEGVYWTFGVHPEFAGGTNTAGPMVAVRSEEWRDDKLVAIGEVGLDYHYEGYDRAAQIRLLEEMLQLAREQDLPVSLHIREAFADAWAVLDNFPETRGVVHSFTGSKRELGRALEHGFYIGVNGLATYTTTPLPPLERMVLETDAPFLTPVPFRGKINQPGYVAVVAHYLAEKLGVAENLIVEQTTKNAREIFKI